MAGADSGLTRRGPKGPSSVPRRSERGWAEKGSPNCWSDRGGNHAVDLGASEAYLKWCGPDLGACKLPNCSPAASCRGLGALWGHLGGHLGPAWAVWGQSWSHVGPSWSHVGQSWRPSWAILGHLGRSGGSLGAMLGRLGGHLGPSWAVWGPSWGHLGPSWSHVGPSWGRLGAQQGFSGGTAATTGRILKINEKKPYVFR